MAKTHQNNADYKRKHSVATKAAMKSHAEARRCPKCQRGGAVKKIETDEFTGPIFVCRYADCGWSR
jgi:hypothetical protein